MPPPRLQRVTWQRGQTAQAGVELAVGRVRLRTAGDGASHGHGGRASPPSMASKRRAARRTSDAVMLKAARWPAASHRARCRRVC